MLANDLILRLARLKQWLSPVVCIVLATGWHLIRRVSLYGTQIACRKLILESGRADASQARPNYVPCTQQNVNLARLTHVRMDKKRNHPH